MWSKFKIERSGVWGGFFWTKNDSACRWDVWKWVKHTAACFVQWGKQQLGLLFPIVLVRIPGNLIFTSWVKGERRHNANRRRWRERGSKARCPQDWIVTNLRTTYIFKTNKFLCFDLRPLCYLTLCDDEAPSLAIYGMNERHISGLSIWKVFSVKWDFFFP